MSQKRNKIILLIGIIIIITFIVFAYLQKTKQVFKTDYPEIFSRNDLSVQYNLCKSYLEKSKIGNKGNISTSPQVFCKVNNTKVELIPNDEVSQKLKAGDLIIMIVNVPKLLNQKYFDAMATHFSQPAFKVPKKNFHLCVTYKPYFASFFGPSRRFQFEPNGISKTSCSFFDSSDEVSPIGIAAKIPPNDKGEPLGLIIFIPTRNTSSWKNLTQKEIKDIINKKQYFMLYNTILSIQ